MTSIHLPMPFAGGENRMPRLGGIHGVFRRMGAVLAVIIAIALAPLSPARAATLIRDADIEYGLGQLAAPILQAAGLSPASVGIYVVKDPAMNAFVLDANAIYIHTGMILRLKNAAELQAVIAHEAAHIANGHLTRRALNAQSAKKAMLLGAALSVAAGAISRNGSAAGGIAIGIAGSAKRVFFGHTRVEESAADQSAVRYLAAAGIDTQGAVRVMALFAGQEALPEKRQDIYAQSHPLSRDRLRRIKSLAQSYQKTFKPNPTADYWFDRSKGKLSAFIRNPKWTFSRLKDKQPADVRAMREAVAYHRLSQTDKALAAIDRARKMRPNDPFYDDLRGQILLESRQWSAAARAYGSAAKRARNNPLIIASQARALILLGGTKNLKTAVGLLERSTKRDWRNSQAKRDLGTAYAKLGNNGMAALVTAESHALRGRFKEAGILAQRAAGLLPHGSAGWQRAQDVLNAVKASQ